MASSGTEKLPTVAVAPMPPPVLISASLGIDCPFTVRNVPAMASVFPVWGQRHRLDVQRLPTGAGLLMVIANDVSSAPVVAFSRAT